MLGLCSAYRLLSAGAPRLSAKFAPPRGASGPGPQAKMPRWSCSCLCLRARRPHRCRDLWATARGMCSSRVMTSRSGATQQAVAAVLKSVTEHAHKELLTARHAESASSSAFVTSATPVLSEPKVASQPLGPPNRPLRSLQQVQQS